MLHLECNYLCPVSCRWRIEGTLMASRIHNSEICQIIFETKKINVTEITEKLVFNCWMTSVIRLCDLSNKPESGNWSIGLEKTGKKIDKNEYAKICTNPAWCLTSCWIKKLYSSPPRILCCLPITTNVFLCRTEDYEVIEKPLGEFISAGSNLKKMMWNSRCAKLLM